MLNPSFFTFQCGWILFFYVENRSTTNVKNQNTIFKIHLYKIKVLHIETYLHSIIISNLKCASSSDAHLQSYKLRNSMKQKPKKCIMLDLGIENGMNGGGDGRCASIHTQYHFQKLISLINVSLIFIIFSYSPNYFELR